MWSTNTDKSLHWQGNPSPVRRLEGTSPFDGRRERTLPFYLSAIRRTLKRLAARQRWGVLVVFLLWQGPIPVCHAHGTLANSSGVTSDLADHLVEAHQSLNPLEDVFVPWHWHWVILADHIQHSDRSDESDSHHETVCCSLTNVCLISEAVSIASQTEICWAATRLLFELDKVQPLTTNYRQPSNFLSTFSTDQSLPERLSVFRC